MHSGSTPQGNIEFCNTMKNILFAILLIISAAFITAWWPSPKTSLPGPQPLVLCRTETVRIAQPIIRTRRITDTVIDTLMSISLESIAVQVPIEQSVYTDDSTYTAYVSGFRARLDSIALVKRESIPFTPTPAKNFHWGIGVQAGYGLTPAGFQPYLGVGVSFGLSF